MSEASRQELVTAICNLQSCGSKRETHTYNGWRNRGYAVYEGEKSRMRNKHGEPLFTSDQVIDTSMCDEYDDYETGGDSFESWFTQ